MFRKIMVPVDLAHEASLARALTCAGDLARHYKAELIFVGVTTPLPGKLGHNPAEYEAKLKDFAAAQGKSAGAHAVAHMAIAHDPTTDLDDTLLKAVGETGADLVVMASHIPTLTDYIWPSNGGKIAAHAAASVMVVRG